MAQTLASFIAAIYIVFGLLGVVAMFSWPSYRVADLLNAREKGISLLSIVYYICVGYLIFQHSGMASGILAASILYPMVVGWLSSDRRYRSDEVGFQLWMTLAQLLVQAACIVVIVF